ncbi:hypothetical protein [Candidatus Phytoplasma asiaticum]
MLTYLNYLAEYSCLKILTRKQKTSIARVRKKCKDRFDLVCFLS